MVLAGLFGTILFLALIVADWLYFSSSSAQAGRYGCPLASFQDPLVWPPVGELTRRFDAQGLLRLKHGVAHLFPEERMILLRSRHGLEPSRFRTAWPMKASLQLSAEGTPGVLCIKRMPWSSVLLTSLWFLIVGLGTIGFIILYLRDGGLASLTGILMGLGILGIGLLVLAFGLVTIAFAYRLENHRLTQVYDELRAEIERT